MAYVDIDDTVRQTHGYAKQGAGFGYSGVKGLNALIGTVCTPLAAPVIAATRLRRGSTNSARGAARLVADALVTAKNVGAAGLVITRADSAFYTRDVIAAIRRGGARFSITARHNPAVIRAIIGIDPTAWVPIHYPNAVFDEDEQRWISDAEVAEVPFTAFTSRRAGEQVTARLIVRRVKRLNPATDQGELFTAYRHHAVFTDTPLPMLHAEADHRGHAIIEQVIADLKDSALAHLPSGKFTANAAWLVLAAIAYNLTRAAGALASAVHARARTATIRTQLIGVPVRSISPATLDGDEHRGAAQDVGGFSSGLADDLTERVFSLANPSGVFPYWSYQTFQASAWASEARSTRSPVEPIISGGSVAGRGAEPRHAHARIAPRSSPARRRASVG